MTILGLGRPLGYQQITGLSTVKTLTVPDKARLAIITCTAQNVRWRDDGVDPTATVGQLLKTTDPPLIYDGDLSALEFIEASASAVLNVSYYA